MMHREGPSPPLLQGRLYIREGIQMKAVPFIKPMRRAETSSCAGSTSKMTGRSSRARNSASSFPPRPPPPRG